VWECSPDRRQLLALSTISDPDRLPHFFSVLIRKLIWELNLFQNLHDLIVCGELLLILIGLDGTELISTTQGLLFHEHLDQTPLLGNEKWMTLKPWQTNCDQYFGRLLSK
jgi:hypothetical protein